MKTLTAIFTEKTTKAQQENEVPHVIFDHRPMKRFQPPIAYFPVEEIECVETIGPDSDYVIMMKSGPINIFRCSCAITFKLMNGQQTLLIG